MMRFECESCGHLGEAAAIEPVSGGVALVCAECDHKTALGAPDPTPKAQSPEPKAPKEPPNTALLLAKAVAAAPAPRPASVHPDPTNVIKKKGIQVNPGKGEHRCPKCGYRQMMRTACRQCGLDLSRVSNPDSWEQPPKGKEALFETLNARWKVLAESKLGDEAGREDFINFASASGLLDVAARRYRFYAQDCAGTPEAEIASEALGRLVERMHAEFVTSHGQSAKEIYTERARQARSALYVIAAIMCFTILVLAIVIFGPF